jgi:putative colanic acid biosynthesis UDP-glucose lipid carrier transferase
MLGWATRTLGSFDERVLAAWVAVTPVALFAAHLATPLVLPRVLAAEGLQRVAIVAGAGSLGRRLAERIAAAPYLGIRVAGYFDDRAPSRLEGLENGRMLGNLGQLAEYAKKHRVDLIYVTLPMASQPRIMKLLDELHDTTASVYFTPDIFIFDLIQGRMDSIGGIPVLAVCETPFSGMNGVVKRVSDLVLGALILALISPILAAIAVGVKLSSPGPVLFRQRRYGLDGREIVVYKFRSMTVTEDGPVVRQATKNDARVTRFGAFLRRTSLDELPQFINVLQGRMSIVGPRPHAVAHNEMYRKLIKSYMVRHKVRPGITGWAQVNGLRGETETVEKMKARIEYDLDYLRNWSLGLDLAIIWKTIWVVLKKPETAY